MAKGAKMSAFIDLTNCKFGRLTALHRDTSIPADRKTKVRWVCHCECGTVKTVMAPDLRSGKTVSCGCKKIENAIETGHANKTHGQRYDEEYNIWRGMKQRCLNPKDTSYTQYGGRGIRVCDRWLVFENFFADMGKRPGPEYSIDRRDTNGDYEPGNCRWATAVEQQNNRRDNVHLEYNGKIYSPGELAALADITRAALYYHLDLGRSVEDIVKYSQDRKDGTVKRMALHMREHGKLR